MGDAQNVRDCQSYAKHRSREWVSREHGTGLWCPGYPGSVPEGTPLDEYPGMPNDPARGDSRVTTEYGSWLEARQRQEELAAAAQARWDGTDAAVWREHRQAAARVRAATPGPPPVHNDGPSMHDLVIKDLLSREPQWDLSVGSARHLRDQVAEDLLARKEFGLDKYGTILQIGNGRNFLLDLYQELLDAVVYARGRLLEVPEHGLEWLILFEVYDSVAEHLVRVRRLMNAAEASTESLSVCSASVRWGVTRG